MLDKHVTREGTLVIKGGEVFIGDDWEISGGGMCREVAAMACLWAAQQLMERARSLIEKPGGDGRTGIGMPDGWPGGFQPDAAGVAKP